jgi:hypothetical protein
MSFLLRLRADYICLRIWRVISKRVAGGIVRLKSSKDNREEMLLNSNTFVYNVINLADDCLKGPNLIKAPLN